MSNATFATATPAPTRRRRVCVQGVLIVAVWLALTTGGCGGGGGLGSSAYLLAPELVHYGASYAEWGVRWTQWVYETPAAHHPILDTTGADATVGQVDPVWFLCGIFGSLTLPTTGSAVRDCTLPNDVALFFPIIEIPWDNQICVDPDTTYSFSEMRDLAAQTIESTVDLHCEVDGVVLLDAPTFADAVRFRAQAPEFSAFSHADNVWVPVCGDPAVPVVVDPIALDGIWVMLAPLAPGLHTIHFSATTPFPAYFHLDITYHITVLP